MTSRNDRIKYISDIITYLRKILVEESQKCKRSRGTIITVWNNKGGVGKTTTTYFLSLLLSNPNHRTNLDLIKRKKEYYKILAIDYDHNQGDLTKNFKCNLSEHYGKVLNLLKIFRENNNFDQSQLSKFIISIPTKQKDILIDLLAADKSLSDKSDLNYSEDFTEDNTLILRKLCLELAKSYDYIIIDAPPNYQQNVYAREAINAADCLLPIALWGGRNSFENYYSVICDLLPKSRHIRRDGGPENLGLWINRYKPRDYITEKQTREHISNLIDNAERKKQRELERAFFCNIQKQKLRLIEDSIVVGKANYSDDHKIVRIPWYKRTIDIYTGLLQSIIGEKR